MRACVAILAALLFLLTTAASAQTHVSFPTEDGGVIFADAYGAGDRAVVLVHGGQFKKESWAPQAQTLVAAGYRVLAMNMRGFGESHGPGDADLMGAPHDLDVLAAVRYLRAHGAKTVDLVGGSMGGSASGDACIESKPGEIHRVVMLGAAPYGPAEKLKCPVLYIVARDDTSGDGPRLPGIQAAYDKSPQPKKLIVLDGSAHAQFLFETNQSDRVMREILDFLAAK